MSVVHAPQVANPPAAQKATPIAPEQSAVRDHSVGHDRSVASTLSAAAAWVRAYPGLLLAGLVLATVVAWALVPALFATHDPYATVTGGGLKSPGSEHLFGTDSVGRDLYSRVIYGARESLGGAGIAVALGLSAGTLVGLIAGSGPRVVEEILMRLVDVLLAIPGLLLALTVVVILGPGTTNVAIAVGVGSVASFARLVRSQVVSVRSSDYVEAAIATGARGPALLFRHILPNATMPIVALVALQFGGAILALSTLGFLGYGVEPPHPEWGMIIAQGRDLLAAAWWITTLPGLVVVAVVLASNRLARQIGART